MTQFLPAYSFATRSMAPLVTGFGISSIIFLILTAQVWIYFWRRRIRSRENKRSKSLVAFIWLMQAAQMVITTRLSCIHTMEFDDVSHFNGYMSIDWALYTGIWSLTTSLVHSVFISRVFRLEKSFYGKRRISFVLIAFCVMEQVFGFLSAIFIAKLGNNHWQVMIMWSTSISLGCSAINDVLIAGTLVYILYKHRTVSPRTNQMIMKLIIFCSQTGLITTVAACIAIGIWAACRFDMYHLYMCFPVGGSYATCLLANFIARESYLQPQTSHEPEVSEISFGPFTQVIHVGLPDNNSGQQETLAMQEGTHSSKASSC
ncbi:uncharacterized protein F5891DRAFT_1175636 [Suillus fuscotomentosus]|uniref:DUF6534 domain-containing protein n=1 Tax=Suillus fuscotomentosus TaxID=1912939 RepID=A0AAD4HGB1_9AGAM|nr:uncharacterized protein F5891DRAFT_1175636 [Suillus fuscotomentosus]KAG1895452.1 hypothetical protein F5891DRAFT_1175636 [Suillus fuscotomentosus]